MAPRANWKSSAVRSRAGSWIRALREARIVFRTVGWGKLVCLVARRRRERHEQAFR
jgi:hypothetical protein